MAKFRESGDVNDFVLFRNACEERKLRFTLTQLEKMKKTYHRQSEKEKLFFAVQYRSVPVRRKISIDSSDRSLSAPTTSKTCKKERKISKDNQLSSRKSSQSLLEKRKSLPDALEHISKVETTELEDDGHDFVETQASSISLPPLVEASLKTRDRENSPESSDDIATGNSIVIDDNGSFTSSVKNEIERELPANVFEFIRRDRKSKNERKTEQYCLSSTPARELWEKQLESMKTQKKPPTKREKQEAAQWARDRWKKAFDVTKNRQSPATQHNKAPLSSTDTEKTFVKFLPKNEQVFYIKDAQFAQRFMR